MTEEEQLKKLQSQENWLVFWISILLFALFGFNDCDL